MSNAVRGTLTIAFTVAVVIFAVYAAVQVGKPSPAGESQATATPSPDATKEPQEEPPLALPQDPKVVVLGDSWSTGYAATPGNGMIDVLRRQTGWAVTVVPEGSGTGFINPGPEKTGAYLKRLNAVKRDPAVDLVVIQGGLNDGYGDAGGETFNAAVAATVDATRKTYPNAELLAVGPVPPQSDRSPWVEIDSRLAFEMDRLDVPYVSPMEEGWLARRAELRRFIDYDKDAHPNTAGHRHLGGRLVEAIRSRS